MSNGQRLLAWITAIALMAGVATPVAARPLDVGGVGVTDGTAPVTGGAAVTGGGLAPVHHVSSKLPPAPSKHAHGRWLSQVTITEYWPAPEAWFRGRLVTAPGLPGLHRIDWLYSATGVSMQGDGLGDWCRTGTV